jgi:anti-sigma factor RsiW
MASCREVAHVLQAYLDGQVDEVTARRVAVHLDACRRCGFEARTYLELKAALARHADRLDDDAVTRLRTFGEQLLETPPAAEEPPA